MIFRTFMLAVMMAPGLILPALADGVVQELITAGDKSRLDRFEETRKAALDEARSGDPARIAELDALLAAPHLSLPDFDLGGEWRCRTIKAGGLSSLVVYDWFKCRVSDDGAGWKLEKLSGSQRTVGRFYDDAENLPYLSRRASLCPRNRETLWRGTRNRSGGLCVPDGTEGMADRIPRSPLRIQTGHIAVQALKIVELETARLISHPHVPTFRRHRTEARPAT